MAQFIISAAGVVGTAIAGAAAAVGTFAAVNVIQVVALAYTVIDALTNKKKSPVDSGQASPTYTFSKLHSNGLT
jgi:hypothetical protein